MNTRVKLENGCYKDLFYFNNLDNVISYIIYYNKNNVTHREDGPAVIWYNESGMIIKEMFHINNRIHRLDGPAIIKYIKDNNHIIKSKDYYIHDRSFSKEDFDKHPEVIKIKNINRNLKLLNKV